MGRSAVACDSPRVARAPMPSSGGAEISPSVDDVGADGRPCWPADGRWTGRRLPCLRAGAHAAPLGMEGSGTTAAPADVVRGGEVAAGQRTGAGLGECRATGWWRHGQVPRR